MMRRLVAGAVLMMALAVGVSAQNPKDGTANRGQAEIGSAAEVAALRARAAANDPVAQAELATRYLKGWRGLAKDYLLAASWFRKAADQGNADAQFNLGNMRLFGYGVPQDDTQAIAWYRKAAGQGHSDAQTTLGAMYALGQGVPQSEAQALMWYSKAADQGNALAQYNLGAMYVDGRGVPQDLVLAYMWVNVAAAHNASSDLRSFYANVRDEVATRLTPQQLADGQRMSREWESAFAQRQNQGLFARPAPTNVARVALVADNGTYLVPVQINGVLTLHFTVDSGAADVTIPADVVMTLYRTGTIRDEDFIGDKKYRLADGSIINARTFRIRSLTVGTQTLSGVTGSVADIKGSLLLGQSVLSRFRSWSMDNTTHELVLEGR